MSGSVGCGGCGFNVCHGYMYRNVEDIAALKRKLEKYKSREWMAAGDEVLLEEIKMYKVSITSYDYYMSCLLRA